MNAQFDEESKDTTYYKTYFNDGGVTSTTLLKKLKLQTMPIKKMSNIEFYYFQID